MSWPGQTRSTCLHLIISLMCHRLLFLLERFRDRHLGIFGFTSSQPLAAGNSDKSENNQEDKDTSGKAEDDPTIPDKGRKT